MIQKVEVPNLGKADAKVFRFVAFEPWLYLAPVMLWFALFTVFPLIYTLDLSLRDWSVPAHPFVGLAHYAEMLSDADLLASLGTTAVFSIGTLMVSFALGFSIAMLLASDDLYGRSFFRSVVIMPYVISPIVVGICFRVMLHPILGVFNYVLGTTGRNWLGAADTAMATVTIITAWELTPFFAIIILSGLLVLPQEPYEAARIDGADDSQLFVYLTLPLLRPVFQVALLMGVIDILKVFALIYATTQGGPANLTQIIGFYIYITGFRFYRLDYAAAMSIVLVIGIGVLALLTMRALREQKQAE